jgi:uncharacterized protein HemX
MPSKRSSSGSGMPVKIVLITAVLIIGVGVAGVVLLRKTIKN